MRTSVLRALVAGACAIAALLAAAGVASAGAPTREPVLLSDTTLPAEICGYPIDVTFLVNNQTMTTFSNGRILITGALKVRLTSPTTSIVLNTSGPTTITPNGDETLTIKSRGRSVFFFFPGELAAGSPGAFLLTTGLATEQVTAAFAPIPGTFTANHAENLCALLA